MTNEIERPDDPQMLFYRSSKSISFRGDLEAGVTRAEWAELPEKEQDEIIEMIMWELIEIGPVK